MRILRRTLLSGLAVGVCAVWAAGQAYQIQGGNVLDANRQVGSGGVNPVARSYDFNAGNRVVSGNVAGGRGFQGYSPIRDPNELFIGSRNYNARMGTYGGLPSSGLSGFQSNSYGVSDQSGGTLSSYNRGVPVDSMIAPYYSPSSSVANTGAIIAGLNRPGTSQLLNPYAAPPGGGGGGGGGRATDPRLAAGAGFSGDGTSLWQGPRLVRAESGTPVNGPVNGALLQSNLFNPAFRVVSPVTLARLGQSDPLVAQQINLPPAPKPLVGGTQFESRLPVDLRDSGSQAQDNRLDTRVNPSVGTPGGEIPTTPSLLGGQSSTGSLGGQPAESGGVFGNMQRWAAQLRPAQTPVAIRPPGQETAEDAAPTQVLRTFVGTEASVANRYMGSAEDSLRRGEYYHAGTLYKMASTIDPANPLPYLGRSLALLAAGDYVTSSNDLFTAIQLFDSLSLFKLDLQSFLPDLKVLDSRRADMETRLASADDYRLRFLLGYADYISGINEEGLKNMEKAVAEAPIVLGYVHLPAGAGEGMNTTPKQPSFEKKERRRLEREYERDRWFYARWQRKNLQDEIAAAEEAERNTSKAANFGMDPASAFSNIQMLRIEPVRRFVEALRQQMSGGITPAPAAAPSRQVPLPGPVSPAAKP